MAEGPVDLLVVQFPENNFTGEIVAEMKNLVSAGTLNILDLMFVTRNAEGTIDVVELTDLEDVVAVQFDEFVGDIDGLLADADAEAIGAGLPPNSSAAMLLYENAWARNFSIAVRNADGEVLIHERIPRALFEAMDEAETGVDGA